jgi:hypothetical protein
LPFKDYLPAIAPPWLARGNGELFFQQVGTVFDSVRDRAVDATRARFPGFGAGASLDEIGRDRQLPRGDAEADEDYAARLLDAWAIWGGDNTPLTGEGGGAGAHLSLLRALALLGLPDGTDGMTIVQQNGRTAQLVSDALSLDVAENCINRQNLTGSITVRPGWTFEGRDTFYSEFGLVFPVDVPTLTAGSQLAASLNATVRKWKPSKALFVGTWVIESGLTLGWPTGRTLGGDPDLGGNVIRYIPPPEGNRIGYTP